VVTERYEGLWRSKADQFSIGDFDQLDGVGDRPHIVISGVSYAPNAILMIRDLLRGKLLFRSQPFERRITVTPLLIFSLFLDNTNISLARVAERPKCLLIGGAVVSGHSQFDAIELGERDPLSNPLFVGLHGVAARKEATAIGENGRSGKFSVRSQCRRIGNRTIEGDPISFGHLYTPKGQTNTLKLPPAPSALAVSSRDNEIVKSGANRGSRMLAYILVCLLASFSV
jgi:hypothetical protein